MKFKIKKKLLYVILILIVILVVVVFIVRQKKNKPTLYYENEKEFIESAELMLELGKAQEEIEKKYPWYFDFPIDRYTYMVVWSPEREQFRIVVKSDESINSKALNNIVQRAVADIEEITGMDIKKEDYYVVFLEYL